MPVYHKKGYFYCPKNVFFQKTCWFVQKLFSNAHVNVQSKTFSTQQ
ncbi:hypothetical protein AB205_0020580, partial [Aquarana catesbeiana]